MKKHYILAVAFLAPFCLNAQNLNPEVQVTNEYETRIGDVSKADLQMRVPDSLFRFDYHFDYSVFDSPYKGAYEFSPYSVTVTPATRAYDGRRLYLRAGAGWVMKPELDLVWAALDSKKAAINVFASGNGFWGKYARITPQTLERDKSVFDKGWDFGATAGVDSRFSLGKAVLRAELGYNGIFTGHDVFRNDIGHSPYAAISLSRRDIHDFSYYLGARYRYVNDWNGRNGVFEDHDVRVDATLEPYVSGKSRIGLDAQFAYNSYFYGGSLRPHAIFSLGNWDFDAGLRVGWNNAARFGVSPDVRLAVHLFRNTFDIYAGAVGRDNLTSYWDYKTQVHQYYINYSNPYPVREIADLYLGFRGHTGFGLRYDLKGGYRFLQDVPFWAVGADGYETLVRQSCGMVHANLALAWETKRFSMDADVHYTLVPKGVEARVFAPAAVTAQLKAAYNWQKRIYAGVSAGMSTERSATVGTNTVTMPWYLDLGLFAEYKFNGKLSAWIKGTNLLNQEIRLSPVYCQWGPSGVIGVTLSL
ncbi:MAG: hypothetical protein IJU68_06995 [Bacteroidales bacterium]|nr:hypothetical protein [Bacteroidales bacterium]